MTKPKFKDIVVISKLDKDGETSIGEAPRAKQYPPMTSNERELMVGRLFKAITSLIEQATTTHSAHNKLSDSETTDPNHVTRLITNEFFFYTQEPLRIEELTSLLNNVVNKTKEIPNGIQLVLGSFAIKTPDNKVMNVTPHITSGEPPSINLIVKNNTSDIDVYYKEQNIDWFSLLVTHPCDSCLYIYDKTF